MNTFLIKVLKVKPGSRTHIRLHGFFEGIVLYRQGYGAVTPAVHKKSFQSYLKYFESAIIKLAKKHPKLAAKADILKNEMNGMIRSDDMVWLCKEIKELTKK